MFNISAKGTQKITVSHVVSKTLILLFYSSISSWLYIFLDLLIIFVLLYVLLHLLRIANDEKFTIMFSCIKNNNISF